MSFRYSFVIAVLGLGNLCVVAGCGSDSKNSPGDGTGGAGGGAPAAGCDNINYASFTTGAAVSFKNDVMPIFGFACTQSSCHNTKIKKAELDLGVRCKYDANSGKCIFPDAVDLTDMSSVPYSPLTPAVLTATYASLMTPAKTVTSASVGRVVPNDPEHSFLVQKVSGKQNAQGYACTNVDPANSTVQPPLPCGDLMPLGGDPLCQGTSYPNFDKIARWIAQGAPNN